MSPPRFLHTSWFAGLVLTVAVLAAYVGTLQVPFLFDDAASVLDNPSIRELSALATVLSPPAESGTGGRPLANLTFALSYALSGLQPWGYHLLNLTTHGLAALALFGVVRRTLELPRWSAAIRDHAPFLAAAIAALWALHPLQTQSVTYISQRTESLMALFYLLTLYCFLRSTETHPRLWPALAVGSCLLGALSKEVIATAPVVVLLFDRTFVAGTFRAALRLRWRLYAGLASSWLLLAWLLLDVKQRGVGFGLGINWISYALTQCKAVVLYLSLGVWPQPLVFDHGPLLLGSAAAALPYAFILAILLAATIWALRYRPALGLAGAWFFIILAPTSSIVPVIQAPIAENRPYLPLVAVVALVVLTLQTWLGPRATRVLCLALATLCLVATVRRNRDYLSALTLWSDTVAKLPDNPRAHNNLGLLLAREPGRQAEAFAHLAAALRLKPNDADSHNNYAVMLASLPGRQPEAIAHYELALQIMPERAEAHINLANLLALQPDRESAALAHYETALRLKPRLPEAHHNLAQLLTRLPARQADALRHFETALRLRPDYVEAHINLANLLARLPGRQADALAHFETALRLQPHDADLHNNLAILLADLPGRQADALAHYETALRLRPDSANVHLNFANLLANLPGREAAAITHYETTLRLLPGQPKAHNNLAILLARHPARQPEAIAHYETALRLDPYQVEAHNNVALLLSRQPGRRPDAIAHFETALRLRPGSAIIHFNLARELLQQPDRRHEAAGHFAAALKIDPNFTAARDALQRLD